MYLISNGRFIMSYIVPFLLKGLKLTSGLASIIGLLLYVKQDSIVYHPTIQGLPKKPRDNPKGYCSPAEYRVPFETHRIKCEDGIYIHSWLMQNKSNTNTHAQNAFPTIIFFHGNAGNIGIRLPNAVQMMKHLNANILLVEYRGFGESDDAKVNEAGLKLDAEAALRFAATHTQIDPNQVFVFGRSLGGGVAFHMAHYAEQQGISLAGVMVENTFLSISKMVDALMPYLAPFKALVLRIGWDSLEIAPRLNTPILYLAGEADELVPHSHMRGLYDASTKSRLRVWHGIKGGSHNESWVQGGAEYWLAMRVFMEKALTVSPSCSKSGGHSSGFEVDALNGQPVESSIPVMKSDLVGMLSQAFSGSNDKSSKKVT